MQNHTKVYVDFFGYGYPEEIKCEMCGDPAVDITHTRARGMGGSKSADHISNLVAMCRECHHFFGDRKKFYDLIDRAHDKNVSLRDSITAE